MARKHDPKPQKKLFTLEEATSMLPLLKVILRDITSLAQEMRARHLHLVALKDSKYLGASEQEEVDAIVTYLENGQEKMEEYVNELRKLNVELKDFFSGLIDFPCWMDGREVYLCWRLGEEEIAHWHELDAGFAGRQPLPSPMIVTQ